MMSSIELTVQSDRRRRLGTIGIMVAVVVLDLAGRTLAGVLSGAETYILLSDPVIGIRMRANAGTLSGVGAQWGGLWLLLGIGLVAVLLMHLALSETARRRLWWPYGLLLGGVVANGVDRLIFGHVRDYLVFLVEHGTFNLADVALVLGVLASAIRWPCAPREATG